MVRSLVIEWKVDNVVENRLVCFRRILVRVVKVLFFFFVVCIIKYKRRGIN